MKVVFLWVIISTESLQHYLLSIYTHLLNSI